MTNKNRKRHKKHIYIYIYISVLNRTIIIGNKTGGDANTAADTTTRITSQSGTQNFGVNPCVS